MAIPTGASANIASRLIIPLRSAPRDHKMTSGSANLVWGSVAPCMCLVAGLLVYVHAQRNYVSQNKVKRLCQLALWALLVKESCLVIVSDSICSSPNIPVSDSCLYWLVASRRKYKEVPQAECQIFLKRSIVETCKDKCNIYKSSRASEIDGVRYSMTYSIWWALVWDYGGWETGSWESGSVGGGRGGKCIYVIYHPGMNWGHWPVKIKFKLSR